MFIYLSRWTFCSPRSLLPNLPFIHLSSQNFCGRNDRLVQQKFSITTQLLSILLPPLGWYTARCRGSAAAAAAAAGVVQSDALLSSLCFCIARGNFPWHVKAGGSVQRLCNGMWTGCTGLGGEDDYGSRYSEKSREGGRVSSWLLPKQMEDNSISCDSIKAWVWMAGH